MFNGLDWKLKHKSLEEQHLIPVRLSFLFSLDIFRIVNLEIFI